MNEIIDHHVENRPLAETIAHAEAPYRDHGDEQRATERGLVAGVVHLLTEPTSSQGLGDFVGQHLDEPSISSLYSHPTIGSGPVERIVGVLATAGGKDTYAGEISEKTGLSPGTVSKVIADLIDGGYVQEGTKHLASSTSGRSVIPLGPTSAFAQELARSSDWQSAVLLQKLAEGLGSDLTAARQFAFKMGLRALLDAEQNSAT